LKLLRPYMAMRLTLVGAAVVAITPLCLSFMPPRQSGRAIAIINVRIFDGSTVIPTGAVIIEGGKIKSVGKTAAPPDGAEIIDGTGHTLLPGLIDSHAHACGPAPRRGL
jgi:NagA composite domain